MTGLRLSGAQARRVALAAQGFATPRPAGPVTARHIRRVLGQIAILQIDSVNVFCRAHYLPILARLGPYPRELLDRLSGYTARPRNVELFEYWAHAASLISTELHPLLRWRMDRADVEAWAEVRRLPHENPALLAEVATLVRENGPIRAGDTGIARPPEQAGQMWNWHEGKIALEYLFYAGQVTTAKRVHFERYYDLTDRVLPAEIVERARPADADALRELVRISARALGVATEPDLRDYFRLPHAAAKAAVTDLVASGELIPAEVSGWSVPAYLWAAARRPRRVAARALLSPFDSLIWYRERTNRLFGFHYRIEIYTPEPQRQFGYYVLPFLLGETLVGRVDLKTDRQAGVLLVQSAWLELGHDPAYVAAELAAELAVTASWLGLDAVVVKPRGDLAKELAAAVEG